eukprot:TRINITY_DN44737_c0_g1_i1.p1 TRINITY_DN44737_c0_g1~~TRINITY_DN44737_c0_g1_i1.p1  ORF type:complete len:520 (-),score=108.05 TRINITY_DN44737_c0_g1_i1:145-1704(-)
MNRSEWPDEEDTFDTARRSKQSERRELKANRASSGGLRPMARSNGQSIPSRGIDQRGPSHMHAHMPPSPASQEKKKPISPLMRRLKALVIAIFLGGYLGLISYLVWWLMSERRAVEGYGRDSPECKKMICPLDSECSLDLGSGLASCMSTTTQNVQTVELILGIVVGVPCAVCLPCTVQWLIRIGCPSFGQWLSDRMPWNSQNEPDYSEANQEMDLETLGEMLGKARFGDAYESKAEENPVAAAPREKFSGVAKEQELAKGKEIQQINNKTGNKLSSLEKSPRDDDGLGELFAPVAKKQIEKREAEAELDLLFQPNPRSKQQALPVGPRAPPMPPEEDDALSDLMVSKAPPKPPSEDLESAFSAMFHRPARNSAVRKRALPTVRSSAPARRGADGWDAGHETSDITEGLSVLFQSTRRTKMAHPAPKASSVARSADSGVPEDLFADQDVEEDYFYDEELGDPPDFFAYALKLASEATGARSDFDAASDANERSDTDSLCGCQASDMTELFHAPLGLQPL